MRTFALILLLVVGPIRSAEAEQDPMDVQRCVWSCLANSPGASSPEYEQCVQRHCTGFSQPAPGPVRSDWQGGVASDGVHRYATTPAEQGYALTYFCSKTQSFFTLDHLPVPPGQYRLIVGNVEFLVPFDMARGVLSVNIPPVSPFMDGLRQGGDWLTVQNMQRGHVIRFSLRGADAAIGQAIEACFS